MLERLQIIVDADTKGAQRELEAVGRKAERELGKAETSIDRTAGKLKSFGTTGLVGSAAILGGFGLLAKAADDADIQVAKLENSIKGSSSTFADNGGELVKLAEDIQQVTAADADAIIGAESLLVQFGLTEDQVKTLTPLIVDLSRKLGIDLETAAKTVGKAVDGNAGALKRYGIDVDEAALKADGFTAVLGTLQQQVGGFARAEGETFSGQIERLKNNLGDIAESVGVGAADVLGGFAQGAADIAAALNEANPGILNAVGGIGATAGIVGVAVSALTLGAGAAVDFAGELKKGNTVLTEVGENGKTQFTKIGKAIGGIALVGSIVGIAETVASVANTVNDIDAKTKVAFDNLRNNLDGTSSAAADAFAGLVELEDKSAEFAGIWQGLGAEVQFRGIQADVEEFRTAFDQVLEGLGPEAAQKIVDGLRAQNTALDQNSDQYRTNAAELDKSQEAIDGRRDAILKATIAERDQKRATQEATEEYDRQTGTVEGISVALEDVRDFLKLTTIEFEANAAAARGFTESLERSTFQDEQIGAALNFNEAMGKALTTVGALPDELDAAKIALVGVGDQADDTGEKALGAFLAIGDQTSKLLSTFIQAGDPEGARNLATILRAQVIQALQDQGITDPQRVDELLGLVGLQDVQIEAAIRFANAEEEILRVQTLLALFETALNEAPAELLLQISAQIGAGDLEGATTTIRNWVAATSDDPATSEIGLAALINQFPDQQLQDIISKARDYAGANPIELRATFNQSKAVIDTISAIAGVVAAANNYLDAVVQQNIESGNLSDVGYQELVQNRDINGNGVIGRAIGGPVNERTPYMVGERGPELFVPNAAGRIVPTNELGGGQSVNITQNITSGDPILTAAEVVRRQRDAEFLAGV
jgi:hypothetical protein